MPKQPADPDAATFRTKIDLWLIVVVVASLGGALAASVAAAAADADAPGSWIPSALMLGTILFIVVVAIPTRYTLSRTHLLIRFGRFRRSVPYSAIRRVHPSRNPLSSPAWSLDRIAIHYEQGGQRRYALISPVQRDEFLKLLGDRARLQESARGLVPVDHPDGR